MSRATANELYMHSLSFNYSDPAALPWMFISDKDSFSVEDAIAATGPLTPTPTNNMSLSENPQPQPPQTLELDEGALVSLPPSPPSPPVTAEITTFTAASATEASASASVSANEDNASNSNSKNLLPLILAPIMAVVGLAALVVLWRYLYKRRKAKRVAPSAEFKQYQRASIPLGDVEGGAAGAGVGVSVRGMQSMDTRPASYAAYQSAGDDADADAPPPAFTPGLFKDPIFEKGVAMSLANQSGTWSTRHGHGHASPVPRSDGPTERQDSLPFSSGGDSPASLSHLGQGQMERQHLIPPEERYYNTG